LPLTVLKFEDNPEGRWDILLERDIIPQTAPNQAKILKNSPSGLSIVDLA
jgi:hypothetical protein